jgi:hypothetical protein
MTTLLSSLERALPTGATRSATASDRARDGGRPVRRSAHDWTTDDLMLLLRDRRPSARRIVAVLDELAEKPDVAVPLSDLAPRSPHCRPTRPITRWTWPR